MSCRVPTARLLCNPALRCEPGRKYQVSPAAVEAPPAALLCSELTPSESDGAHLAGLWAPSQGGRWRWWRWWTSQLWPWLRATVRLWCTVQSLDRKMQFEMLNFSVIKLHQNLITWPHPAVPVARVQTSRFSSLSCLLGPLRDFLQPPMSIYRIHWLELSLLKRKLIPSNNWEPSKQTNECLQKTIVTPLKFVPPQCYISCYISNKTRQLCFSFFDLNFLVVVSSVDLAACWCVLEWCWQCCDIVICISGLCPCASII